MKEFDQRRILLLGGTSETAPLATKLAFAGFQVLVSTATDEPLQIGEHLAIKRRCGRLNLAEMARLMVEQRIPVLIDATHPYASVVHEVARKACEKAGCAYLRYQRQETQVQDDSWCYTDSHEEAAALACESGQPILLTIGSRHLLPYVEQARQRQVQLYARVLNRPESVGACESAKLEESRRILGRGPFSYEDNVKLIRQHEIGVVVTKESGKVGGVEEKWRAAEHEGCQFVVVRRPVESPEQSYSTMSELLAVL